MTGLQALGRLDIVVELDSATVSDDAYALLVDHADRLPAGRVHLAR